MDMSPACHLTAKTFVFIIRLLRTEFQTKLASEKLVFAKLDRELAALAAYSQKSSTAPAVPASTVDAPKSDFAAADANKNNAQRKKKSGFENAALAKAWLAGDD